MTAPAHPAVLSAANLIVAPQVGDAAALGAAIGAVLVGIWYATEFRSRGPRCNPFEAIGWTIIGICGGALVVLAAVPAGLWWLDVTPLPLTVPFGVAVAYLMVGVGVFSMPRVGLGVFTAWIVLPAAGLALVAAAGRTSRPGLAELVVLAGLLGLGALPVWIQTSTRSGAK
jgi:hypothetical protein